MRMKAVASDKVVYSYGSGSIDFGVFSPPRLSFLGSEDLSGLVSEAAQDLRSSYQAARQYKDASVEMIDGTTAPAEVEGLCRGVSLANMRLAKYPGTCETGQCRPRCVAQGTDV